MAAAPRSNVKISNSSHQALRDLAASESLPMQEILDRAIEDYRRARFLDAVNEAFAALQNNATARTAEQQERDEWSSTAADGLEEDGCTR